MPEAAAGGPARRPSVLVLGAGGRLGRLVARAWSRDAAVRPTYQSGRAGAVPGAVGLDILADPDPLAALAAGHDAVLMLAGVTQADDAADLELNTTLALAALEAARRAAVPRVFLMSSAAVYGRAGGLLDEADAPCPVSDYGRAKARMEEAVLRWRNRAGGAEVEPVVLRLGNVAGADALLGAPAGREIVLDRFADGTSPRRSYIGPVSLARCLARLATLPDLPGILNLAAPGAVAMSELLDAAGKRWRWQPAPEAAIACVELSVVRLAKQVEPGLIAADAAAMVAELAALGRDAAA